MGPYSRGPANRSSDNGDMLNHWRMGGDGARALTVSSQEYWKPYERRVS